MMSATAAPTLSPAFLALKERFTESETHPDKWGINKEYSGNSSSSFIGMGFTVPVPELIPAFHRRIDLEEIRDLSGPALKWYLLVVLYWHPDEPEKGSWVAASVAISYGMDPKRQKSWAVEELCIAGVIYKIQAGHSGKETVFGINEPRSGVILTIQQIDRLLQQKKVTVENIEEMSKEPLPDLKPAPAIDLMYIRQVPGIKETRRDVYRCRCPICGDSKKSNRKARGYFYPGRQGNFIYFCHNCRARGPVGWFLKQTAPDQGRAYIRDLIQYHADPASITAPVTPPDSATPKIQKSPEDVIQALGMTGVCLDSLTDDHPARAYVRGRGVSPRDLSRFWVLQDGTELAKTLGQDMCIPAAPHICTMLKDYSGIVSGVLTRSLKADVAHDDRYRIIPLSSQEKLFYTSLDKTMPVYVVEGVFDTVVFPNSVAANGLGILNVCKDLAAQGYTCIACVDNEIETNPDVRAVWQSLVDAGIPVLKWGDGCQFKDLNEMFVQTGKHDHVTVVGLDHVESVAADDRKLPVTSFVPEAALDDESTCMPVAIVSGTASQPQTCSADESGLHINDDGPVPAAALGPAILIDVSGSSPAARRERNCRSHVGAVCQVVQDQLAIAVVPFQCHSFHLGYTVPRKWQKDHMSSFQASIAGYSRRHGVEYRFVWRLALDENGLPHYYGLLWLPVLTGQPPLDSWWSHGECVHEAVADIDAASASLVHHPLYCLPGCFRGARWSGHGGLSRSALEEVRYYEAPRWLQDRVKKGCKIRKDGEWWVIDDKFKLRSPWRLTAQLSVRQRDPGGRHRSSSGRWTWVGWTKADVRLLVPGSLKAIATAYQLDGLCETADIEGQPGDQLLTTGCSSIRGFYSRLAAPG